MVSSRLGFPFLLLLGCTDRALMVGGDAESEADGASQDDGQVPGSSGSEGGVSSDSGGDSSEEGSGELPRFDLGADPEPPDPEPPDPGPPPDPGEPTTDPAIPSHLQVFLATANGFAQPTEYEIGAGPTDVHVLDLDADGVLDLLVAEAAAGTLGVLGATAPGAFEDRGHFEGPARSLAHFRVEPGTGLPNEIHVLVGSPQGLERRMVGSGGSLTHTEYWIVGELVVALAVADLDDDGTTEIVALSTHATSCFWAPSIRVHVCHAEADFPCDQELGLVTSDNEGRGQLIVRDVNGDGADDVVVAVAGLSLALIENTGDGRLGTTTTLEYPSSGSLAAQDLPGTSSWRLIAGTITDDSPTLLIQTYDSSGFVDAASALVEEPLVVLAAARQTSWFAAATGTNVEVRDQAADPFWIDGAPWRHALVEVADLDGDGLEDLVVAGWDPLPGSDGAVARVYGGGRRYCPPG